MLCLALAECVRPLLEDPLSPGIPAALHLLDLLDRLGMTLNLWQAQTLFAQVCQKYLSTLLARRLHEEAVAHQVAMLRRLGERLEFYAVEGIPLHAWE